MVVSFLKRGARVLALAGVVGAVVSPAAFAQTAIPGLFNTGVNAAGTGLQALGATELHYSIVAGPGITNPPVTPFVLTSQLPGTYAQSPNSEWIWVNANGTGSTGSPYTFRITFDLTGLNLTTASLSGQYAVDNNASISLNGGAAQFALTGDLNFGAFHPFSFTSGFVSGVNTLDFLATDAGNPGGLNVTSLAGSARGASSGAAPEPGSLALALLGSGLLPLSAVAARRRHARRG